MIRKLFLNYHYFRSTISRDNDDNLTMIIWKPNNKIHIAIILTKRCLLLYIYDHLVIELDRCCISLWNKTFLVPHGRGPDSFTYRVLIGRVSIFEHKQNAENVAYSLSIHRDRRCTDVYVCTPRHLTLDGEAFHCAVGHAFLRMPDWYAEVSSGMQRHPIFADRSRLRPREFRLLHTASRTAPAGFKSAPWATASKSDT